MRLAALAALSILTFLALVHFYWASGGTIWKAGAIPSRDGVQVISPTATATAMVGILLLGMAAVVGSTAGLLPRVLPVAVLRGASAMLASIFMMRAVGEFRYVGVFKKVRDSVFGRLDTYIYSPLCLLLAALIAIVAFG